MTPDNRRLLLGWLKDEQTESRRLAEFLAELADHPELSALARFLAVKESEERARQAVLDREQWFRSFSWRMVVALFAFGILGLALFALWGGQAAFLASIFFIAGGASFYLVAQTMAIYRSHSDRKALEEIRARCRRELEDLRKELSK